MKKHRSIIITSFTIFILLSCFIPQSEGRTFLPLDKILDEPLCNERYADYHQPFIDLFYYSFQNKKAGDYTPFCSGSAHFFSFTEISHIVVKKCVFSKCNQYIGTSQRPPPLSFNQFFI